MRQVPTKNYLIIGDGRLATHLHYFLKSKKYNLKTWSRKNDSDKKLAKRIKKADYILLAISDDSIESFYKQNDLSQKTCIHFSGQFSHPKILGLHPLMTFSEEIYTKKFYDSIPFVGDITEALFKEIFPNLKNDYYIIKPQDKAYYHSLCSLSGNGTTLIWELVAAQMEHLNLPGEIIKPYLLKVCENILYDSSGRFTGPWYRKDINTVNSHLEAIKDDQLSTLYSSLYQLSQNVAQSKGDKNEKHSSDARA